MSNDTDALVAQLVLQKVRTRDSALYDVPDVPEHFVTCPEVTVTDAATQFESWWDTGVEATRITATLQCPHHLPFDWEWANLGELPDLLRELDEL